LTFRAQVEVWVGGWSGVKVEGEEVFIFFLFFSSFFSKKNSKNSKNSKRKFFVSPSFAGSSSPSLFFFAMFRSKSEKLWIACSEGDLNAVKTLSADPAVNLNWVDKEGHKTILFRACAFGRAAVVEFLLTLPKVDVNEASIQGATPLYIACQQGHRDCVKVMLTSPALDVNREKLTGESPLYFSCSENHILIVTLLLGDMRVRVNDGKKTTSPFMAAGSKELVLLMASHPRVDVNHTRMNGATALIFMVNTGDLSLVQCLLASDCLVDTRKRMKEGDADFSSATAAEWARLYPMLQKLDESSENQYLAVRKNGRTMADLIDRYEREPDAVRNELRRQLNLPALPPKNLHSVPFPAPPPASSPSLIVVPSVRKVAVEYNGEIRVLTPPVVSLEALSTFLREQLGITGQMTLNYFDPELEVFAVFDDLSLLPAEKPRLKILTQAKVILQSSSWWAWSPTESWITKGFETTRYSSLLVKEGVHIHHQPAFDKFLHLATQLGFDPAVAFKIFAISNEKLLTNFENYCDTLQAKHRANPALFKKDDWKLMPEVHSQFSTKYSWNDGKRPRVIPMLQGTTEGAAWQICQQGFGVVGTTDDGFYGAGVYFTSKFGYANKYARSDLEGTKTFIVGMVIPGNSFPVVEHPFAADGSGKANPSGFKGKACRTGYQSHFTVVDDTNIDTAFPVKGPFDWTSMADELVIFEGAQALPIFVFSTK